MKLKHVAILALLALGACSSVQLAEPPPIVSTANTVADERAMADALVAYNAAAAIYLDLNARGLLTGDIKAAAKSSLQVALRSLQAARTALAAANAPSFRTQLALAIAATSQATSILPKGR